MKLEYSQQGLTVLDFNRFIAHYENLIIDDLYKFELIGRGTLTNRDVKKIFFHHLIKIIVDEYIWSNKGTNKLVMVFNTGDHIHGSMRGYFGEKELIIFLEKFIKQLEKMLPIRFVIIDKPLDEHLMVNVCLNKIKQVSKKEYTFQKIKLFAKRYELTFLTDRYLNCLKTKQVLI